MSPLMHFAAFGDEEAAVLFLELFGDRVNVNLCHGESGMSVLEYVFRRHAVPLALLSALLRRPDIHVSRLVLSEARESESRPVRRIIEEYVQRVRETRAR